MLVTIRNSPLETLDKNLLKSIFSMVCSQLSFPLSHQKINSAGTAVVTDPVTPVTVHAIKYGPMTASNSTSVPVS